MSFTDEQPFLDAVFDRYADDRPRLVYADYLDDAGETERAELIRLQLALAKLDDDDPQRPELADRLSELLPRRRAALNAELAGLAVSADFRRGIPDSATVDAVTFLESGDELFRRLRLRRLRLLDVAPVLPKLVLSPLLAEVRELDLCGSELGTTGVAVLARSARLKNLTALDVGFNGLDDTAVEVLSRSSNFPNLTSLAINDNDRIGDPGLKTLAASPFFAGLTELDVSGNDIGETGLHAVITSATLAQLRAFRLNGNQIGDAGLTALVQSPLLGRMVKADPRLELRDAGIGPTGVAALATCPALGHCTSLDLTGNYLGDAGVAALLRSPYHGALKVLRLAGNQITDAGIIAARRALDALFSQVRLLDVSRNRLTRVGLNTLAELRGDRPVRVEVGGNVQAVPAGDAPVSFSDVLPGILDGVTSAARLRRRLLNPHNPPAGP